MNPKIFGKEHLIYVLISVALGVAICVLAKIFAKTEKSKKIVVKCAGAMLFLIIFANRLALVFEYDKVNWLKLITDSFCSTSSYVLSLAILFGKKNNNILHFVWLISLAGGINLTIYYIIL